MRAKQRAGPDFGQVLHTHLSGKKAAIQKPDNTPGNKTH
jgi:hypothetical protein